MGNPEWARDEKFAGQASRLKNSDALDAHLNEWTRNHDHIELAKMLQDAGVAAGPVRDSGELHKDPPLWGWGFLWGMEDHEAGKRGVPPMPVKMRDGPARHQTS